MQAETTPLGKNDAKLSGHQHIIAALSPWEMTNTYRLLLTACETANSPPSTKGETGGI